MSDMLPCPFCGTARVIYEEKKIDEHWIHCDKGKEQYVFLYNDENRAETLRLLGRYASNPELSFTWYDAAVLSQKIRQESLQQARESQLADMPQQGVSIPVDKLF